MMNAQEQHLLSQVPEYIAVGGMLKATPHTDGDRRILFIEASNENPDLQGEIVLQKALEGSKNYFLKYGNIDIDHFTRLPPDKRPKDYLDFEIGRPVHVEVNGKRTFVKAELFNGESARAKKATTVWDSLTRQKPPSQWYPSVGGDVFNSSKSVQYDGSGKPVVVIGKVRWNNIGLSQTPVNSSVPGVSNTPIGIFTKSFNGIVMAKALTASAGSDVSALSGGGALMMQSYPHVRNLIAKKISQGKVALNTIKPFCMQALGLAEPDAELITRQFIADVQRGRRK